MKSKIITLLLLAALCSGSAVSCGTVDNMYDSSSPAIGGLSSSSDDTLEDASDKTTEAKTTATTASKTTNTATTTTTAKAQSGNTSSDNEPEAYNNEPDYDEPEYGGQYDDPAQTHENTPSDVPENTPVQTPAQTVGTFSNSDLSFSGSSLLGDASGIISSMGAASSIDEAPSCLSNGADVKVYHYPGLDVSCYIDGGSEIVYEISISGSGYSTPKGISVGSSRNDVIAAYGEDSGGNEAIYGSGGYGLYIYYSGDTVINIIYYAEV